MMIKRVLAMAVAIAATSPMLFAATGVHRVKLFPNGTPDGPRQGQLPTLDIYLPKDNPTHTAVVVCPGGGYVHVVAGPEGKVPAQWLNKHHVAAFVLRYRHGLKGHHLYPQPIDDGQRAIRYVRYHAKQFGIDPQHIGVWGFSAGGHLAGAVSTHFDAGRKQAKDPIQRVSSRPDFTILSYAVITMREPYVHKGSRLNLLGKHPSPALVKKMSDELQVTAKTPPAFIYDTDADTLVPSENSVAYYLALHQHGVPAELHIFRVGGHGTHLGQRNALLKVWPKLLARWMAGMGWMKYQGIKPQLPHSR